MKIVSEFCTLMVPSGFRVAALVLTKPMEKNCFTLPCSYVRPGVLRRIDGNTRRRNGFRRGDCAAAGCGAETADLTAGAAFTALAGAGVFLAGLTVGTRTAAAAGSRRRSGRDPARPA